VGKVRKRFAFLVWFCLADCIGFYAYCCKSTFNRLTKSRETALLPWLPSRLSMPSACMKTMIMEYTRSSIVPDKLGGERDERVGKICRILRRLTATE
jgi:hypothetical protein